MSEHIHWNEKGQLLSTQFDDIYFSTDDGLAETQYVFLAQNQLEERFCALKAHDHFTIAETGFGTGLNFLAACQLWVRTQEKAPKSEAHLHFISVEKFPLDKTVIQRALGVWPELEVFLRPLLVAYPETPSGFHRIALPHNIHLTLIFDDAVSGFQQLIASPPSTRMKTLLARQWRGVDAWFLDGFAPSKNPSMWTQALFSTMVTLSHASTSFATFTAAGIVRRGLLQAGFTVEKISGYGHKREMMRGLLGDPISETPSNDSNAHEDKQAFDTKTSNNTPKHYQYTVDSWALVNHDTSHTPQKTVAVIGGGIAGCHSAYALAKKGYRVTIFEKNNALASGASGNAQGVIYTKLSAAQEPQGDFNLYSLLYAQQFYRDYWETYKGQDEYGQQCGVMQLGMNEKLQKAHQNIAQRFDEKGHVIRYLSASEASAIANTSVHFPALFFPQAGWISPLHLCQWLCLHPLISVNSHQHITHLEHTNEQWQLHSQDASHHFDNVIIANANDALQLSQSQHLPLKNVRGQVTHCPTTPSSIKLSTAICGKGYIAPAKTEHCLGATFNLGVDDTAINPEDHLQNLHNVTQQTPDVIDPNLLEGDAYKDLSGRVGFRCVTPDYLPVVGPAPIKADIETQYQALKHNAKHIVDAAGSYYPNLYVNVGHGSRGLAYTPLCSEILASLISGCPPPIHQALLQKLSPTRFIIRDMVRSK